MTMLCLDRHLGETKFYFMSKDWKHLIYTRASKENPNFMMEKPASIDKMGELAEKLAVGLPFVRVDFYDVDGHPYFGEITFFSDGGTELYQNNEFQEKYGAMIDLSPIKKSGDK